MAKEVVLAAEPRSAFGKEKVKKLRTEGLLPGVIYGKGFEPISLTVNRHDLVQALHHHGAHALVTLKVSGREEYLALVKDVQVDPVRQEALHVDFHKVEANVAVQTQVPVHLVGDSEGVRMGGIVEAHVRDVTIEALPRAIPEFLEVDISGLQIGDHARVADIRPPAGVTIITDPDEMLASVIVPRVAAAAEVTEEEAAAAAAAAEGEEAAEGAAAQTEES